MTGNQLDNHGGQLRFADFYGLNALLIEKLGKNIQPLPIDRIGNQGIGTKRLWLQIGLLEQGVLASEHSDQLIAKQGSILNTRQWLRVRGDDQIQIAPGQSRQRRKRKSSGEIQGDIGPFFSESIQSRHEPLKA